MKLRIPKTLRVIAGFIIAPLSPSVIILLLSSVSPSSLNFTMPQLTPWFLGLGAVLGYPVAFVIGIPLYVAFRTSRQITFSMCLAGGGALGAIDGFLPVLAELSQKNKSPEHIEQLAIHFIPIGILCGMTAGAIFWVITQVKLDRPTAPKVKELE